jgi:two-component system chemotaxis sensor kinase CheA
MGEFDDVIAEFLVESREGLDQLDRDLVALEETPDNRELLSRIFRCFHTVKGTAGFLGFGKLESLTHAGESLLSRMRDGELRPSGTITTSLLSTVDAVRVMLGAVEASGNDGDRDYSELTETLKALCRGEEPAGLTVEHASPGPAAAAPPPAAVAPPPAAKPPPAVAIKSVEPIASSITGARDIEWTLPEAPLIAVPPAEPAPAAPASAPAPEPVAAPAVAPPAQEERHAANVAESVRVDLTLLDNLVDLAGELVLTRNHIVQLSKGRDDTILATATQRLNFVTAQLQDGIMRMRMQPVNNLFSKFPRVVRDLARSCRKLVRLELDGRDTELDKSLIETIKDPMVHLLRNCVDHGIESPEARAKNGKHPEGRIVLRAYHQNGLVHIEVADDGNGIALDKVKKRGIERGLVTPERAEMMSDSEVASLIFLPGFSTAEQITNVSGRGVGMDVVKTNVEAVGGTVEVDTRMGQGTTFTLKIPLTLAIIPALVVRCADARYAIPQVNVIELVRLTAAKQALEWIHGAPVFRLRGKLLPVVFLEEAMGGHIMPPAANDNTIDEDAPSKFLAVVQGPGRQFGLVVDAVLDQQEIVVKPLPKLLAEIGAFAGATLLGDGRVALILDILGIAQRARLVSEQREDAMVERARAQNKERAKGMRTLLLLQGPDDARLAVPLEDVSRLETIDVEQLESGGQHQVLQYRGEIMPLLRTRELLPERRSRMRNENEEPKMLRVVVLGRPGRALGLVVDDVLDVVETAGELRRVGCRQGVVGTLVVQNRVTEVLDLAWLIAAAGFEAIEEPPQAQSLAAG